MVMNFNRAYIINNNFIKIFLYIFEYLFFFNGQKKKYLQNFAIEKLIYQ